MGIIKAYMSILSRLLGFFGVDILVFNDIALRIADIKQARRFQSRAI